MTLLPNTLDNEISVIASAMQAPDTFAEISQIVTLLDFSNDTLYAAFGWMLDLFAKKRPVDMWTIHQAKKDAPEFAAFREIMQAAPPVLYGSGAHSAAILADRAALRRTILSLQKAIDAAGMAGSYADAKMGVEAVLMEAMSHQASREIKSVREAVADIRADAAKGPLGDFRFATGFRALDKMTSGGFGQSHLIIVAGPTSAGKTTLATNILTNIAESGVGCGAFSLEMSTRELVLRMGLSAQNLGCGEDPLSKIEGLPVWITDRPDRTIESIRGAIRLMVLRYGIKVIMVDYLQLITPTNPKDNRERQVAECSRQLKIAAKESNVVLLALSQVNEEGRMRESRAVEQDADAILHIVTGQGRHYLWLSKNRHGPKHGPISEIENKVEDEGIPLDFHDQNFRFTEK